MADIVLTLSGGLDSTVLLWHLLEAGHKVRCLSVDYGQRHRRELQAAVEITRLASCEHKIADLKAISSLFAGSSQTSPEIAVPEGHYAEESMKLTVVPNRNMVMLALAGAWAISTKSKAIAIAAHAGDHTIYPDCRPDFVEALGKALNLADWHPVSIISPFVNKSKAEIVTIGRKLNVPMGMTWSCYKGATYHCGKCGTCVERLEAFQLAGFSDPVRYEA